MRPLHDVAAELGHAPVQVLICGDVTKVRARQNHLGLLHQTNRCGRRAAWRSICSMPCHSRLVHIIAGLIDAA